MCSFDVSSLFTNVPLDETIQICLDKLYALANHQSYRDLFWKIYLFLPLRGAILCLKASTTTRSMEWQWDPLFRTGFGQYLYVRFRGKMGNENGARPTIWFRYVDDTFTLFPNKDTAVQFLSYLNTRHKNIQFTTEFEQDEEIPFLDVLIKRQPNNSFSTSIYRKKTFTGLYTQWDSFTPRKYKINLIRTLPYRSGLRISSSPVCYSLL